jgi:hypothetical protein
MAKRTYHFASVEWDDIVGHGSAWCDIDEVPSLEYAKCYSVGYIVGSDKGAIRIVSTLAPGLNAVSDCTVIPMGVVTKIKKLGKITADFTDAGSGAPLRLAPRRPSGRK